MDIAAIKSFHEIEPKSAIWDKYSKIVDTIQITGPSLIVAIYKRPEKTRGGIIRPDKYLEEDFYQGKVGLVIKTSHYPVDEEDRKHFDGRLPQVGDWVMFRASDGLSFGLADTKGDCRYFADRRSIRMIIPDPEMIW